MWYTSPNRITIPAPKSVNESGVDMRNDTTFKMNITRMATKDTQIAGGILRTSEPEIRK